MSNRFRTCFAVLSLAAVCAMGTACGASSAGKASTEAATASDAERVLYLPTLAEMGTIKLADYNNMTVSVPAEQKIDDAYVDQYLKDLAGTESAGDEAVQNGYTANIDYKGTIDGQEFDGGSAEKQDVTVGSNNYIPGFEDQLIGHKAGDTFDITVTFPEDYEETLAGKTATFHITLNEVKKPVEVTDTWVVVHSPNGSKTVAEFREEMRKNLEGWAKQNYETSVYNAVMSQLEENSEIECSDALLAYEKQEYAKQQEDQLTAMGYTLDSYAAMFGSDAATMKASWDTAAEEQAKKVFIEKELADELHIAVGDETEQKLLAYEKIANGYDGLTLDQIRSQMFTKTNSDGTSVPDMNAYNNAVISNAVRDYIVNHVTVTDETESVPTSDAEVETDAETAATD